MADMVIGTRNEELAAPVNVSGDSSADSSGDSAGDLAPFALEAAFGEVVPASLLDGF